MTSLSYQRPAYRHQRKASTRFLRIVFSPNINPVSDDFECATLALAQFPGLIFPKPIRHKSPASQSPVKTMPIRDETPQDADAIHHLTEQAFAPMPFSDGTEPAIVRALRKAGDLTISLVTEKDAEIIGHVAFSPVTINGTHGGWFGLGPISVRSDHQKQGIGTALVQTGLDALIAQNAKGCALIGNPAVYGPMGFTSNGKLHYQDLDDKAVQYVAFSGPSPEGTLKFAPAFDPENTSK